VQILATVRMYLASWQWMMDHRSYWRAGQDFCKELVIHSLKAKVLGVSTSSVRSVNARMDQRYSIQQSVRRKLYQ